MKDTLFRLSGIGIVLLSFAAYWLLSKPPADPQGRPIVPSLVVPVAWQGVPADAFAVGDDKAPVKIRVFVDPACPLCKKLFREALPVIREEYIKPGKARMWVLPVPVTGPAGGPASQAIVGAAKRNAAVAFADELFAQPDPTSRTSVANVRDAMKLNANTPSEDAEAVKYLNDIAKRAIDSGLDRVPSMYVTFPGRVERRVKFKLTRADKFDLVALRRALNER